MSNEFKLVPFEPTDEMLTALLRTWYAAPQDDDREAMAIAHKAMLAAAPQPPALGGEPEVLCWVVTDMNGDFYFAANRQTPADTPLIDRAHLAPLQAEIERLNSVERSYQLREELLEQVKGERDRMIERACELSSEVDRLTARTAELEGLLREVVALDPRGEFMGWQLDGRIGAALSKP